MPMPSSDTEMVTCSEPVIIFTVTFFPFGVYLKAFESRLKNIFSNLSRSTHAYTLSVLVWSWKSILFSFAIRWKLSIIFCNWETSSVFSTNTFIFLFWILRKSSSWLTRRSIRSVFLCTKFRCSRTVGEIASCARISDTGLDIKVKGVRNSCEISVKKRNLILDKCCSKSTWCRKR